MTAKPIDIPIDANLYFSHAPFVLDLSGAHLFDIFLRIDRGQTDNEDSRPLTLLTTGSLFDIPHAFEHGLLQLVDQETSELIEITIAQDIFSVHQVPRTSFFTLQPRGPFPMYGTEAYTIPLRLQRHLKTVLKPGHKYCVQTNCRNLGVRWWNFGSLDDFCPSESVSMATLPLSEPGQLIIAKPDSRPFTVVESLPIPPPISITMAFTSNIVHRSGTPQTYIQMQIINQGNRPVTIKAHGEQPYIKPFSGPYTQYPVDTVLCQPIRPSEENFSVVSCKSGQELMNPPIKVIWLREMESWSRPSFTTLEPGVPFYYQVSLLRLLTVALQNGNGDEEFFWVRLRPVGVWWFDGTKEEMFVPDPVLGSVLQSGVEVIRRLPGGPKPPLWLQSRDEVMFRLVD